ncbi:MAG TPA: hypothetical protein VGB24_11545 [Longimicrobium sp.]|jgi:hypothetical protein|uniref:hypothetical protein n=1 Tax=Longimicrobium sp. TaxID=2029185 RepID=UPI002EDA46A6
MTPPGPDTLPLADDFVWRAETVHLLVLSPGATVARWNEAARRAHAPLAEGAPVARLLTPNSASLLLATMEAARAGPAEGVLLTFSDGERYAFTLSCRVRWAEGACLLFGEPLAARDSQVTRELMELSSELARITRERAKVAAELSSALQALRESHWHVKKIQEFLPICAQCHRVPAGEESRGEWRHLVSFLADNGLLMTHGYCPECEEQVMAQLDGPAP